MLYSNIYLALRKRHKVMPNGRKRENMRIGIDIDDTMADTFDFE